MIFVRVFLASDITVLGMIDYFTAQFPDFGTPIRTVLEDRVERIRQIRQRGDNPWDFYQLVRRREFPDRVEILEIPENVSLYALRNTLREEADPNNPQTWNPGDMRTPIRLYLVELTRKVSKAKYRKKSTQGPKAVHRKIAKQSKKKTKTKKKKTKRKRTARQHTRSNRFFFF